MHFREVCRNCGTVVSQCRCPAPNKTIQWVETCPFCPAQERLPEKDPLARYVTDDPRFTSGGNSSGSFFPGEITFIDPPTSECVPGAHVYSLGPVSAPATDGEIKCACGEHTARLKDGRIYLSWSSDLPPRDGAGATVVTPPSGADFIRSFDGMDWARAFVALVRNDPTVGTDVDTMTGWFANAIMRGHDEHAQRVLPLIRGWVEAEDKLTQLLALSHANATEEIIHAAHVAARRARMRVRALVL